MANMIKDQRGSLAVSAALCLAPVITLVVAQVQITERLTKQTRLHQAQTSAVLAAAKEGEDASSATRNSLVSGWMEQNLLAVLRNTDNVDSVLTSNDDEEELVSTYYSKPLAEKLLDGVFDTPYSDTTPVRAERYYNPIEAVIVLDSSSSMYSEHDTMVDLAEDVTETLFRGKQHADDVRVGLIAYGRYVNIGREYADKLITPQSRKLFRGTSPTDILNYEQRANTLREYNPALVNDLLAPGGPGEKWDLACVARPRLPKGSSSAQIKQYAEDIDTPPASPSEGFTLLMGDDRDYVFEDRSLDGEFDASKLVGFFLMFVGNWPPEENTDILDVAAVPHAYVIDEERYTYSQYQDWGGASRWGNINDESVAIYYDCSPMPMLVGANSKDDVLDRIKMFKGIWSTGVDEGLAWAMRQLSPNWNGIWDKDNFPAEYHSTTEKRILLLGGSMTAGYYSNPEAVTAMCDVMKENGVDLYVLLNNEGINSKSKAIYEYCVPDDRYYKASSNSELPEMMSKMAQRQYRVRLAAQ
jgi:Flp pilus assembly protein TadG